jgi:hypothetical protein
MYEDPKPRRGEEEERRPRNDSAICTGEGLLAFHEPGSGRGQLTWWISYVS